VFFADDGAAAGCSLVRGGFTHLWIKNFLNAAHPQPPSRHWTKS
jgi:hypothetical protein